MRRTQCHAGHPAVIPLDGRPRRRAVAGLTLRPKLQPVTIVLTTRPVTVEAPRRCALVRALEMARFARDVTVATVQMKRRLIVESAAGRVELRRGRRRTQEDNCRSNRDYAE